MEGSSYKNTEGYPDPTAHQAIRKADYQIRGKMARERGQQFEDLITASLDWYRSMNMANIEKTPEPLRPLAKPDRHGRFIACYTAAGQPDFKGTLAGGRAIVFEAKHTDTERMCFNRVTEDQVRSLNKHAELGAMVFVVISFGINQSRFRIPWNIWINMKEIFGRKYLRFDDDIEQYNIRYEYGILKILEGLS